MNPIFTLKRKHLAVALIFVSLFITNTAIADSIPNSCAVNSNPNIIFASLDHKYESEGIRAFYTLSGLHGLADTADTNNNNIPDYIEDIVTQAHVARTIFNRLGFRDPLESPRYRGAEYIDIFIYDIGYNGLAIDEPWVYTSVPLTENKCSIQIRLSSSLNNFPGNYWAVVSHELFHLYQYGYTMFKASWFLEGLAKLAEKSIRVGALYDDTPLPSDLSELESQVFSRSPSHQTRDFWSRLSVLTDLSDGQLNLPSSINSTTYVNNTLVIKDDYFKGSEFILSVLQGLDAEDDIVSFENGWDLYSWTESDQKSAQHNMRMLEVIQRALMRTGANGPEVEAFLNIQ